MKRIWKIVGVATLVAILGVAAVGAVAYAQDDGEGFPFDFAGRFKEALAGILGVTVEEYDNAVDQAQSQVRVFSDSVPSTWKGMEMRSSNRAMPSSSSR